MGTDIAWAGGFPVSNVLLILTNHHTVNCECGWRLGVYIEPFGEDGEVVEDIQVGELQEGPLHRYGSLEEGIGVADILPLFCCISSHFLKQTAHTITGPLPVASIPKICLCFATNQKMSLFLYWLVGPSVT